MIGSTETVGLVGTGLMGEPMARRLLGAGFAVVVTNRTRSKAEPLQAHGVRVESSPSEVACSASSVLLSLPSGAEVMLVVEELLSVLPTGSLIIDTSTIAPHEARAMQKLCHAKNVAYVDTPVSGGTVAAEAGMLSFMAGGTDAALDRAEALCAPLYKQFVRCGPPGSGSVAKACNQLVVAATIEIVAEALMLAASNGVDPSAVRTALLGGFAASRILELHGQRMLDRNFVPGGKARLQLKDIDIIASTASDAGIELEAFSAAGQRFRRLVEEGGGELDHSAVVTLLEADLGRDLSSWGSSVQRNERL